MPGKPRFSLKTLLAPVLLLALTLQGCASEGKITSPKANSTTTLTFHGLEPLPGNLNYQAWLVAGSSTSFWGYPLVLFDMDEEGRMVDPVADTVLTGPFPATLEADAVLGVAVSLETTNQLVSYSSFTFILGGEIFQGTANLSVEGFLSFDQSLSGITGQLVLSSPTNEDPEDELSGVWFMDPTSQPTGPGLSLPEAPDGWIYEGWIVLDTLSLSMGKFALPNIPDSASVYSGTLAGPPFPGEDFLTGAPPGLTFPTDLSGATVFVTIEPWREWDVERANPFFVRLLETQIPVDAVQGTLYAMDPVVDQLPTGVASIQDL